MTQRYFVDTPITGSRTTLVGAEAHHLAHVMRAKPGDPVVVFDGRGGEYAAQVETILRATVELEVLSHRPIERELTIPLTVAAPLPKGDRQRWLIEKLVELGVTCFLPLDTERAVAQPSAGALDRLRRTVIESSKQCGRNRLMGIEPPRVWIDFVRHQIDGCRIFAHPGAKSTIGTVIGELAHERGLHGSVIAVGPEGGLTDEEAQLALAHGWRDVDLGPRILRVETAAVMMAALLAESAG